MLGIIAGISFGASSAVAFKISPMIAEMAPAGPRARLNYLVESDSPVSTAIQIGVVRREQAEDGTEYLPNADDEFLVFPAQFVLQPNEKQIVQVQWLGQVYPERELAYRIVAEQLPVDLNAPADGKNNMQLLVRYLTAVYIVPSGIHSNAAADLVVDPAEADSDAHGQRTMDILVSNRGPTHIQLRNVQLTIRSVDGDKTVTLPSRRLPSSMLGENILAGSIRSFRIPWPPELSVGPITVSLEVQEAPQE